MTPDGTVTETGWLDRLWVRGGVTASLAVAVNLVVVVLANSADVAPGFQPLSVPSVAFFSAAGAVGAAVVYHLLRGRSDRPVRAFRRIAAVVLVLSFVPDLGLLVSDEAATVLGVVTLMIMHVTVAAIAVWLIPGRD